MKLVSVIIPTYGRPHLLSRAIDSVLNQSYKNVEVIVVDDNIDVSYSEETKAVVGKYGDVIYKKNQVNLGGALSRNEGVMTSTGEYITFLDDDDYYLSDKIKEQVNYIEATKSDVVLCHMQIVDSEGHIQNKKHIARCNNLADFIIRGVAFTPMILMTRTAIYDVEMFDDTPRFQDHLFLLKLLEKNKRIVVLEKALAVHYEHQGERITNSDKRFLGYNLRLNKEKSLFPRLSNKDRSSAKLKHATIESKIIADTHNRFKGLIFLLSNVFNIRTKYDLKLFVRNLVRNTFYVGRFF